jgi:hypothetical protein
MKRYVLVAFLVFSGVCASAQAPRANQAVVAANQWMERVDAGNWDRSWDATGTAFKSMVTREYWRGIMAGRAVHGMAVNSRLMNTANFPLPGFPDGQYMVVRYQVDFRDGTRGIDIVALRLEGNDWRVASYSFISPTERPGVRPLSGN